jgi:2-dehydro-3-deoxyphosphooctonate aldolase (KDO 8-P synthase)
MKSLVKKVEDSGNKQIMLTDRGVTFGYNNLVSDFRAIPIMKELGYPVVFDATHSVQRPGGLGGATGGDRDLAPVLANAAMATGIDGVFMEVHSDPDNAMSDGPNQVKLSDLERIITNMQLVRSAYDQMS